MSLLPDVPRYAFGTSIRDHNTVVNLAKEAIKLGCRHFDCAPIYKTQVLIGQAMMEALQEGLVTRMDLHITSKLPINMMYDDHIESSFNSTLKELQLDYLDCYLIHAPFATQYRASEELYPTDNQGNLLLYEGLAMLERCWEKICDLRKKGLIKYAGLSNVNIEQLKRCNMIDKVDIVQNEFHLYKQDERFLQECQNLNIHFEGYAALSSPGRVRQLGELDALRDPVVKQLAKEKNITEAQVLIQWLHSKPIGYIIKTDTIEQLQENMNAIKSSATLTTDDIINLNSRNQNARIYQYDSRLFKHKEYPFEQRQLKEGLNLF